MSKNLDKKRKKFKSIYLFQISLYIDKFLNKKIKELQIDLFVFYVCKKIYIKNRNQFICSKYHYFYVNV